MLIGCAEETAAPETPGITVITFNTGTTEGLGHDGAVDDGYTSEHAMFSDLHYGDGLAWNVAIEDARAFLAEADPDIVAFQEIFDNRDCPDVPEEARPGFVCDAWQPGDDNVVQTVVGPDFVVACHQGKSDKCLAVNRRLGTLRGCEDELCFDALDGAPVADCGSGSRIGRGLIDLVDGEVLTVISVHGSSGIEPSDRDCRVAQFEQIFDDLDGAPGANGERNIILGDLNTDPGRNTDFDESARLWAQHVGEGERFHSVTDVGPDATPTYAALFNIDHVASDALGGSCVHPGATPESAPITDIIYFDHKPVVCRMDAP